MLFWGEEKRSLKNELLASASLQGNKNRVSSRLSFPFPIELFKPDEKVADGCDLNLVETAGGLFSVAGYERDGGTLFEESDGFLHLTGAEIELLGNGCGVIHIGKILNNYVIVM